MGRIKPVSSAQAGLRVKIAYYFTRRSIGKLTGRNPVLGSQRRLAAGDAAGPVR